MRIIAAMLLVLISGISRADIFSYVSLAKDRKIAVSKVEPATRALTHIAHTSPMRPVKGSRARSSPVLPRPDSSPHCAPKANWSRFASIREQER